VPDPPFHLPSIPTVGPCLPALNQSLTVSCRRVGAAAVISAAFVVFGLIDAFVPTTRSFFLALIAAAVTHKRVQPIFTPRGSFLPKAKIPSRFEH
jgi:hypothetical protein